MPQITSIYCFHSRQCHTDQVVVQRPLGHRPAQPPPHPRRPQVRLRRQVRALQEPALPLMRNASLHTWVHIAGGQTPASKDNHKWWGGHNGFMKWGYLWTAMTGMDFRQISHELIQVPSGATLLTWNVKKQKDWSDPEVSENSSSTLIGSRSLGYFSYHQEVIAKTTNLFNVKKTSVQWSSIDSLQRTSVRLPSKLCC